MFVASALQMIDLVSSLLTDLFLLKCQLVSKYSDTKVLSFLEIYQIIHTRAMLKLFACDRLHRRQHGQFPKQLSPQQTELPDNANTLILH